MVSDMMSYNMALPVLSHAGGPTSALLRGSVPRKAKMSAFLCGATPAQVPLSSKSMLSSIAVVLAQVGAYPVPASSALSAAQA